MAVRFFRRTGSPDMLLLAALFLLLVVGLVGLSSASFELGAKQFGDPFAYLKQQFLHGILPGAVLFLAGFFISYRLYKKWAPAFFLASLVLVILVFSPLGFRSGGSGRWLDVGFFSFQPSELLKITFVLYLAAWLSNVRTERRSNFATGFVPFLLISGMAAGLLLLQPATSTVAILLAAGIALYFLGGGKIRFIAGLAGIGIVALAMLIFFTGYRFNRVAVHLGVIDDPLGKGYQSAEALTAIGSGQMFGLGFGQSLAKARKLPALVSDSIFAVIASEFGFVGSSLIVGLFGFLVVRMLLIARKMRDMFGKLTLAGFALIIGMQAFVHIGALSGVLPLTGIPLPFISLGGTAMVVFLAMMGISLNISKYAENS